MKAYAKFCPRCAELKAAGHTLEMIESSMDMGKVDFELAVTMNPDGSSYDYRCNVCGHSWTVPDDSEPK
jgi:hypothetical protein